MTDPPTLSRTAPAQGIDRLLADDDLLAALRRQQVGLLTNAACRTADGVATADALHRALASGGRGGLRCLFAPEHGYATKAGAGDAIADGRDAATGLAVFSLYGTRRAPSARQLAGLDCLIVDLRDVGLRCFTYAATAALAAAAASAAGKQVIVCDRANPLDERRDGPSLDQAFRSFLAYFDVPFVHGTTLAALLVSGLSGHRESGALRVMPAQPLDQRAAGLWVPPSPALRSFAAVLLYPGLVLFEGTNLSVGRGTELPFRCIAAPWLDAAAVADAANSWPTGIAARMCRVRPRSGDYANRELPAVGFEPGDGPSDGFGLGVRLLARTAATHSRFRWRTAPAQPAAAGPAASRRHYVIDALLGDRALRETIERGGDASALLAAWRRQAANTVSPSTTT